MTAAERVFLVSCLLHGSLCQEWAVFLPQSVEVLTRSCVTIPCSFDVPAEYNAHLDDPSCKAIWKRANTQIFDSSLTTNTIQGSLIGDLRQKDCTTIFNDFPRDRRNSDYTFRLECNNALKFNFNDRSVTIKSRESPSSPTLKPARVEVREGTTVSLSCSAAAYCPTLPPTLTWTPRPVGSEETLPENQDDVVTSVLTFNASLLLHGKMVICTALYKKQDNSTDLSSKTPITIRVLYPPRNTSISVSPSGPVLEGSSVTLTCSSDANPAPTSYTWYRVDEDLVTVTHTKRRMNLILVEGSQYLCESRNAYGAQNSSVIQLDVQYPPRNTSASVSPSGPAFEGSSVILTCSSYANPAVENYTWYRDEGTEGVVEHGQNFVLDSADSSHSGEYYCEARNRHGVNRSPGAQLNIQYPPRNTSASVRPGGPVLEGSSVTLTCSSDANPTVTSYTWYRVDGRKKSVLGSGQDVTFKVSKLPRRRFYCEALNDHGVDRSEDIRLDVTFAPEILPTSGCTRTTTQIRCWCESHGNPLPELEWQLDGEPVNQSADVVISEETLESSGLASSLTMRLSLQHTPTVVCISNNSVTSVRVAFPVSAEVTPTPIWKDVRKLALLIGMSVGGLVMLLLCFPLQIVLCKKRSSQVSERGLEDTAGLIVTPGSGSVSNDVSCDARTQTVFQCGDEPVYANEAMLDGPPGVTEPAGEGVEPPGTGPPGPGAVAGEGAGPPRAMAGEGAGPPGAEKGAEPPGVRAEEDTGPPGAEEGEVDPSSLHHAAVGFSEGQARPGAQQGDEEIRGVDSSTAKCAAIRPPLGEERGEEDDAVLEQESLEDDQEAEESGAAHLGVPATDVLLGVLSTDVLLGVPSTDVHLGVPSREATHDSPSMEEGSQLSSQQESCEGAKIIPGSDCSQEAMLTTGGQSCMEGEKEEEEEEKEEEEKEIKKAQGN